MFKYTFLAFCTFACLAGCSQRNMPAELEYAPILPIAFTGEHPTISLFEKESFEAIVPLRYDRAVVIPVYGILRGDGIDWQYVVREPFVAKQADDIEVRLQRIGQREALKRVLIWIPGCLIVSIAKQFRQTWNIQGQEMIIAELHKENWENARPCRMAKALKGLLKSKRFIIGDFVDTRRDYDPALLVRAVEYGSQYSKEHCLGNLKQRYVFWAFNPGTNVDIVMSEESRKHVMSFLEEYIVEKQDAKSEPVKGADGATTGKEASRKQGESPGVGGTKAK